MRLPTILFLIAALTLSLVHTSMVRATASLGPFPSPASFVVDAAPFQQRITCKRALPNTGTTGSFCEVNQTAILPGSIGADAQSLALIARAGSRPWAFLRLKPDLEPPRA